MKRMFSVFSAGVLAALAPQATVTLREAFAKAIKDPEPITEAK